jgi:hypothetical protein
MKHMHRWKRSPLIRVSDVVALEDKKILERTELEDGLRRVVMNDCVEWREYRVFHVIRAHCNITASESHGAVFAEPDGVSTRYLDCLHHAAGHQAVNVGLEMEVIIAVLRTVAELDQGNIMLDNGADILIDTFSALKDVARLLTLVESRYITEAKFWAKKIDAGLTDYLEKLLRNSFHKARPPLSHVENINSVKFKKLERN